jgi:hypothetical protein
VSSLRFYGDRYWLRSCHKPTLLIRSSQIYRISAVPHLEKSCGLSPLSVIPGGLPMPSSSRNGDRESPTLQFHSPSGLSRPGQSCAQTCLAMKGSLDLFRVYYCSNHFGGTMRYLLGTQARSWRPNDRELQKCNSSASRRRFYRTRDQIQMNGLFI